MRYNAPSVRSFNCFSLSSLQNTENANSSKSREYATQHSLCLERRTLQFRVFRKLNLFYLYRSAAREYLKIITFRQICVKFLC